MVAAAASAAAAVLVVKIVVAFLLRNARGQCRDTIIQWAAATLALITPWRLLKGTAWARPGAAITRVKRTLVRDSLASTWTAATTELLEAVGDTMTMAMERGGTAGDGRMEPP